MGEGLEILSPYPFLPTFRGEGQSPQLLPYVTLVKYHVILLSWFLNKCIIAMSKRKAEQNNLATVLNIIMALSDCRH